MKKLRCRDAGFDCEQEIHAPTEDAILAQAAEHAQKVHHVEVTPEMAGHIRSLITEDSGKQARS